MVIQNVVTKKKLSQIQVTENRKLHSIDTLENKTGRKPARI